MKTYLFVLLAVTASFLFACNTQKQEAKLTEGDFIKFADSIETQMKDLSIPWYTA